MIIHPLQLAIETILHGIDTNYSCRAFKRSRDTDYFRVYYKHQFTPEIYHDCLLVAVTIADTKVDITCLKYELDFVECELADPGLIDLIVGIIVRSLDLWKRSLDHAAIKDS